MKILLESLLLMSISSVLGIIVSFAGLAIIGNIFTGMLGTSIAPFAFCIEEVYIIFGSMALALLAASIPAIAVYRTEPTKYLR